MEHKKDEISEAIVQGITLAQETSLNELVETIKKSISDNEVSYSDIEVIVANARVNYEEKLLINLQRILKIAFGHSQIEYIGAKDRFEFGEGTEIRITIDYKDILIGKMT